MNQPQQIINSVTEPGEIRVDNSNRNLSVFTPGPGSDDRRSADSKFIRQSQVIENLIQQLHAFARTKASILVTGESGTGKEMFSRLIHESSLRSDRPFVAVNCAAIPEMLVESEFFGHRRGAFTGAIQQRIGHFEKANSGTILLDEISEIPLQMQTKLLRVLEEKEIQMIGSNEPTKLDVRVVATCNRNLRDLVAEGKFRLDLFHRLNVLTLEIPPLRQRADDIRCLTQYFIEQFQPDDPLLARGITEKAMQRLLEHSWPGNVRELRNVIQRACILCQQRLITTECLGEFADSPSDDPNVVYGKTISEVEQMLILDAMRRLEGDKKKVAIELGITTRTLNNKLNKYRELQSAGHSTP